MAGLLLGLLGFAASVAADSGPAITDRYATVNGVQLHYLAAGGGAPVEGVLVVGSGHWLIDEAPGQVIPKLVEFFGR